MHGFRTHALILAIGGAAAVCPSADAAMFFLRRDLNRTADPNSMPIPLADRVNALMARDEFLSFLPNGMASESFESFTPDQVNTTLQFTQGAGASEVGVTVSDATVRFQAEGTAGPLMDEGFPPAPKNQGRWGTTGDQYLELRPAEETTFTFDRGVKAFGLFGVDLNDVFNQLEVTIIRDTESGEQLGTFRITDLTDAQTGDDLEGNVLFWGIVSEEVAFEQIIFRNATRPPNSDIFAFDDLFVSTEVIPTPGVLAPVGVMGLLAGVRRRRRS